MLNLEEQRDGESDQEIDNLLQRLNGDGYLLCRKALSILREMREATDEFPSNVIKGLETELNLSRERTREGLGFPETATPEDLRYGMNLWTDKYFSREINGTDDPKEKRVLRRRQLESRKRAIHFLGLDPETPITEVRRLMEERIEQVLAA